MTWRRVGTELALWIPVGVMPIVNGAIRIGTYGRWLGEPRASAISSALDVLVVCIYAGLVQRRWPAESWFRALGRGLLWLSLTTLDHFGLGAFVFGIPWPVLAAKYDVGAGELWALVSVAIFAGPFVGRWSARRAAPGSRVAAG